MLANPQVVANVVDAVDRIRVFLRATPHVTGRDGTTEGDDAIVDRNVYVMRVDVGVGGELVANVLFNALVRSAVVLRADAGVLTLALVKRVVAEPLPGRPGRSHSRC